MAHVRASFDRGLRTGSLTPPEINALLFYRLGQFVVWGQEHRELATAYPDLAALLETATRALSRGGIPEPDSWIPPADRVANPVQDSQNVASDAGFSGDDL